MKAKNLLILSPWWPYPADNGSRLRAFHLLRELARCGHTLRLVAGVQEDAHETLAQGIPEALRECCPEIVPVPWHWPGESADGRQSAIRTLLSATPRSIRETPNPAMEAAITTQLQQPTDAVIAFELGMDAYIPPLPTGVPLIIDQVELSGVERAFRQAGTWQTRFRTGLTYVKSATYWRRRLSRYALLTVVSEAEAVAVRQVSGPASRIVIVPNGVDISAYPSEPSPHRTMGQLLYNGALTYGPNQDAALWFVQEILPIIRTTVPQARLTITGRCPLEGVMGVSDHPHVTLTGFLPDLRPTLTASQVAVVSLRSGGGTRLKIIEAFAAHLPVVSTTVGAAGLGVESGTHLFLADTPADFAEATIRLLCNPTLAARIAANARQLAAEHFNWRAIGKSLSAHIEQTVIEATA